MVTKVHAGVYNDTADSGSLRFFKFKMLRAVHATATAGSGSDPDPIGGQNYTLANGETFDYVNKTAVPDTVVDKVIRILSTRATVIATCVFYDEVVGTGTGELSVILENNTIGWGQSNAYGAVADIATALAEAGVQPVSTPTTSLVSGPDPDTYDFSTITVAELNFFLDDAGILTSSQGDSDYQIGGLGGNEHDRDTQSNTTPAPGDEVNDGGTPPLTS